MNRKYCDYLISLISAYLNDTVPEEPTDDIDFEWVYDFSKWHEVSQIAFCSVSKLNKKPDTELLKKWEDNYYIAIKRDLLQSNAREQIVSALHSNGIRTLEVQGTRAKKLYRETYLRKMSDIDFIVDKQNLSVIREIMVGLGYSLFHENDLEQNFKKGKIFVEFHTEFFDENCCFPCGVNSRKVLNSPFSHIINDSLECEVDDYTFYHFNVLHTLKHLAHKGVGIRRIIDLYCLRDFYKDKLDFNKINEFYIQNGIKEDVDKLFAVCDYWFCGKQLDERLEYLVEDIFTSGTHGVSNKELKNKIEREKNSGKKFIKLRYIMGRIFPKKYDLYRSYAFCRKHKLPIVLCWFYRWFYILFHPVKFKKANKEIKEVNKLNK